MKVTDKDIELAKRFPEKVSLYGFGMTAADARISPNELDRLLKLNLIQYVERVKGGCDDNASASYGKGRKRGSSTFIRKKVIVSNLIK